MKTILISLILGVVAFHSSFGQTLKNLTYNASNGQVIANTGSNVLTFTNPLQFATNSRATIRTNLGLGWLALTDPQSSLYSGTATKLLGYVAEISPSSSNLTGFNVLAYTNANTLVIPANLLIAEDAVPAPRNLRHVEIQGTATIANPFSEDTIFGANYASVTDQLTFTNSIATWGSNAITMGMPIAFSATTAAATTRTNLGLGALWLTNTNITNFRTAIGLGSAATNDGSAFQPASANLTNLASNNAINLTNFPTLLLRTNGSAAGLTNFPTLNQNTTGTASNVTGVVAITNGGTGTNTAGGARTNLGLGATWLTNTNVSTFRSAIGLGSWAQLDEGANIRVQSLNISDGEQSNYTQFTTSGVDFNGGNDVQFRGALGLGATWLTNTNVTNFRTAIGLGITNNVTFSNITASGTITATGTLTATGNVTMNGSGNLAPSQTASSDASLMTRGIIYQSQADFNSGDPVGVIAINQVGTGASSAQYAVLGWGSTVTTNTNTAAGTYFGEATWSQSSFSGAQMPANKAVDLTMKGVMLRVETNTNFVSRVLFGVGAPGRTPPAAGNPAATNQSWGVNFFYDGTNQVYQPFWYTTNYNTAPTAVITNLNASSWLGRVYTMRFQQTTNGQISFYINDGLAGRLASTPVWTTNVTWPSVNYGGRYIGMECATATNAAPVAGARIHYRIAYLRYDP